ncbi:MAG: D-glycero-beta-D-manno-heptose-7-phosphate kinase [Candidatus Firestonebacteria bacterium]|nr:D-glycero-beta-D-manno-heptose-7-phosphate kinase [Candidatus Firestonebacteria bacterium]
MKNVRAARLKNLIDRFTGKKILVLGDVMLDEYIWGKVSRISPEAPIPVVHVQRENALPGGAANVANNLKALGGEVFLAGVVGTDEAARRMTKLLNSEGVNTDLLIRDASRPTITKTRVIAHSQQVVRIDRENALPVSPRVVARLLAGIGQQMKKVDAVIISDYNKGLLTEALAQGVIALARQGRKPVTGDPKPENIAKFQGVDLISPNQMEAEKASGIRITDRKSLHAAGAVILEKLHCRAVLITRGEEGMSLFEQGGHVSHIPTVAREVYDVSGAGDTVISTLTLCLAAGGNFREAAVAANCAAGITVAEVGVATTTQKELKKRIAEEPWKS